MKELTIEARVENLNTVLEFLDEQLEEAGCDMKVMMQIEIAVEEIFVNIASYAYQPDTGEATIRIGFLDDPRTAEITFADRGVPYNPLAKSDPDVSLSAEERQIGGLGIYMVKKSMDGMTYAYKDMQNILTIRKQF